MTLTIELTPEEEATINARAAAAGLTTDEFARQLLSCEDCILLTEAEEAALAAAFTEMAKTGESINRSLATMNADTQAMISILRAGR